MNTIHWSEKYIDDIAVYEMQTHDYFTQRPKTMTHLI